MLSYFKKEIEILLFSYIFKETRKYFKREKILTNLINAECF